MIVWEIDGEALFVEGRMLGAFATVDGDSVSYVGKGVNMRIQEYLRIGDPNVNASF